MALLKVKLVEAAGAAGHEVGPGGLLVEHGIGVAGVSSVYRFVYIPLLCLIFILYLERRTVVFTRNENGILPALLRGKLHAMAFKSAAADLPLKVGGAAVIPYIELPGALAADYNFTLRHFYQLIFVRQEELLGSGAACTGNGGLDSNQAY